MSLLGEKFYIPRKPFELSSGSGKPWVQEVIAFETKAISRWVESTGEKEIDVKVHVRGTSPRSTWCCNYYEAWLKLENLGKTWFRTREEAEAKLK